MVMTKFYYCDYITSVVGARAPLLEKKLIPFVKRTLYHKVVREDDIDSLVEIIHSEMKLIRREFPRLRSLDVYVEDSKLPDRDHKFIHFGECYARLQPVLGYAGSDVEIGIVSTVFKV